MDRRTLPPADEMYEAMLARNTRYDGIFVTAVTTTGIFCRPSCPAKKPNRENVEFFRSTREALAAGYRPCKRCRPLEPPGLTPKPIRALLEEIDRDPMRRLRDRDLRDRGLEAATVRRWFKNHHDMTFHAYQRARRLGRALGQLVRGEEVSRAAFANGYESLSGFRDALRQLTGVSPSRSRNATLVHLTRVVTQLGPMLLGATADGVCVLEFTDRRMLETQLRRVGERLDCVFVPGSKESSRELEEELNAYFAGDLKEFTVPLRIPTESATSSGVIRPLLPGHSGRPFRLMPAARIGRIDGSRSGTGRTLSSSVRSWGFSPAWSRRRAASSRP